MAERQPAMTGGCQCGAVRYATYKAPRRGDICHCRMCCFPAFQTREWLHVKKL